MQMNFNLKSKLLRSYRFTSVFNSLKLVNKLCKQREVQDFLLLPTNNFWCALLLQCDMVCFTSTVIH